MPDPDPTRSADPDELRRTAERILDRDAFRERSLPKPFRGILGWIGDRLADLHRPIESLLASLVGEELAPWAVLAVAVGAVGFLAHRIVSARSRAEITRRREAPLHLDPTADPAALDERAEQAAAAGDHRRAVQLRHRAGLIRLARADRLDLRPETTARGAANTVRHPRLDDLTDRFEAIVYGTAPASPDDVDRFRRGWTEVHEDRFRRGWTEVHEDRTRRPASDGVPR